MIAGVDLINVDRLSVARPEGLLGNMLEMVLVVALVVILSEG